MAVEPIRQIAVREQPSGGALAIWDRDQIDVIKTLICPGASDAELKLFGQVCQKTGLDPFSRQIYGLMRGQRQQVNGEWKTIEKLSIQTSIDGFRLIAERSGKYGGQLGPQWCGEDGIWRDVWLAQEYPAAARVGVIRTDWREPLWAVARWDSYVQTHRDRKTGQEIVGSMWQRMPDVMLAKVAESLALRRAFPAELSGLYTSEEMAQADNSASTATRSEIIVNTATEPRPSRQEASAARRAVVDGQVVKDNEGPASQKARASFDASFARGCKEAMTVGLAVPDAPPADATRTQLQQAAVALKQEIEARKALNAEFATKHAAVTAAGGEVAEVDPATCTSQEVHEMLASLDEMLAAVAGSEDDAPF